MDRPSGQILHDLLDDDLDGPPQLADDTGGDSTGAAAALLERDLQMQMEMQLQMQQMQMQMHQMQMQPDSGYFPAMNIPHFGVGMTQIPWQIAVPAAGGEEEEDEEKDDGAGRGKGRKRRKKRKRNRKDKKEEYWNVRPEADDCQIVPVKEDGDETAG